MEKNMTEVLTEIFELEKYLIRPQNRPKEVLEENEEYRNKEILEEDEKYRNKYINKLDNLMGEGELECETFPIELIKRASLAQKYIPLSTEFLKMSLEKETEFGRINVPRFGVYRYGKTSMNIDMSTYKNTHYGNRNISIQITNPQNFPAIMEHPILEVFDFFDKKGEKYPISEGYSGERWYCHNFPKEVFKKWKAIQGRAKSISLVSSFHSIIPKKVKEKVGDARRYFKDDIFIISEKKPEDWEIGWNQKKNVTIDPLVVGCLYKGCYLIDKFDTSYLERYIESEWTH